MIDTHADTVWRVCSLYFNESADCQDAFQDTFLKYSLADDRAFEDDEHLKAWLIVVARNTCLDQLRRSCRKNASLDDGAYDGLLQDERASSESDRIEVRDALRRLADPPRTPLYLSVVEGYTAREISEMLDAPENTVYSWISRGKKQLREALS